MEKTRNFYILNFTFLTFLYIFAQIRYKDTFLTIYFIY